MAKHLRFDHSSFTMSIKHSYLESIMPKFATDAAYNYSYRVTRDHNIKIKIPFGRSALFNHSMFKNQYVFTLPMNEKYKNPGVFEHRKLTK